MRENLPHNNHKIFSIGNHRIRRWLLMFVVLMGLFATSQNAQASFLSLDSIASWGKFPRFCINTYRWGDKFFNSYDSTYVQGSGYRFNIKTKIDSYVDTYDFRYDDDYRMSFNSRPSSSVGLYLTYMAVSLGYDINFSKIFNSDIGARKRFNFQFNCALFGAELYSISNDAYMTITRLGYPDDLNKVDIKFRGFHSDSWGLNLYYFFNHTHYSQAAAFAYSKIQMKSSGSLYAGFTYWYQNYDMDFTDIMHELPIPASGLPEGWDNHYRVKNSNYALKIGYAYNWVFHPGWVVGISEAPTIGIRRGYISNPNQYRTSFSLSNRIKASIIYNRDKRWFFGMVGYLDSGLVYNKLHTMLANNYSFEASAGFRFNLW